jgi:hypothetical protein
MTSFLTAAAALTTTVLIASGCASTGTATTATNAAQGEPVYRTGSNIPMRDKSAMTKEEQERQAAESQRASQPTQAAGSGASRTN